MDERLKDIVIEKARGCWCWKNTPKRYLTLSKKNFNVMQIDKAGVIFVETNAWGVHRTATFSLLSIIDEAIKN